MRDRQAARVLGSRREGRRLADPFAYKDDGDVKCGSTERWAGAKHAVSLRNSSTSRDGEIGDARARGESERVRGDGKCDERKVRRGKK